MLDKFLAETDTAIVPVDTKNALVTILEAGPVALRTDGRPRSRRRPRKHPSSATN
jgi:hypothetical protein